MKNVLKIIACVSFIAIISSLISIKTNAQILFDPNDNFYDITSYLDNYYDSIMNIEGTENTDGTGYKHYKHWKTDWEPKVQPTGDFSTYMQTLENSYDCFNTLDYYNPAGTWDEIGPTTTSQNNTDDVGRLACIAVDPEDDNVILAGSPVGGLYYTEDYGNNWINAGLDLPYENHGMEMFTPGIASIVIIHDGGTTWWYIATGDKDNGFNQSRGVIRTKDKGINWELVSTGLDLGLWNYIRKIIVHPDDPNCIFAATSKGIYRTMNALENDPENVNWIPVLDEGSNTNKVGFFDIEFSHHTEPGEQRKIIAVKEYLYGSSSSDPYYSNTIGDGSEIYWTDDPYGNLGTWVEMPNSDQILPGIGSQFYKFRIMIETTPAEPDLIYAYLLASHAPSGQSPNHHTKFFRYSFNTGLWTYLSDPELSPSNKPPNYGRTAFSVSHANENIIYYGFVRPYYSDDGGYTWTKHHNTVSINGVNKNFPHSDIHDLAFTSNGGSIWAGTDGGPYVTLVGTQNTWENKVNNIGIAIVHYFDQSKIDPNYYLFGGYDVHSQLLQKTDEEDIWTDKGGGDGFGCAFDNEELGTFYVTAGGYLYRYINWVSEPGSSYNGNNFWNIHVKINPGNHNVLYTSYGNEIARSFDQGDNLEYLVSLADLNTSTDQHLLYDMHVAEGNPDYLYLRLIRRYNGDHPRIYKTTNVNQTDPLLINWGEPLIPSGDTEGWVGDIIIDYENPDRFWVCYSHLSGDKIWEYDGNLWTPLTYNLTDCNTGISSLEHIHGTERGLFAGGMHGIFYLEDGTQEWKLYKPGIPNVPKNYIKINYCTGKLVVGTKGRGLWETDLPLGWNNPPLITSDETWEGYRVIMSPVQVPEGVTLTIKGKVAFTPSAKLIVKRGAKLIIDGGTLTNTCDGLWKGVEVWGNPLQPQSSSYQGAVEIINGGTIENANCGINAIRFAVPDGEVEETPDYNYTGGMVLADGSIFKNNNIGVKFWPYNYASSNSLFRNCQFITNNDMLEDCDPDYFIKMSDITGIKIAGCSYTDEHSYTYLDELTSGIESFDANFSLFTTGGQSNVFTGLYDGIRAYTHNPIRTVSIKDCDFMENLRSVYLNTVKEATVTGNTFNPWDEDVQGEDSYCLYLDYCTDYTIKENDFNHMGSPTGIGLVINNSGPYNNEVYNNEFTGLEFATLAQNCNRGYLDEIGLKIKCNDYWDNYQDIAVTSIDIPYPGIARNQGAEGGTNMQAGNRFSLNYNGNDYSDYSTFKQGPITYFHHDPDLSDEPRVEPKYISKHITLDKQPTIYSEQQSCPPNESGGGGIGDEELKGRMAENEFKADSTQAILTALVDGGNTDVLEQEVLHSMPPETYDLYMSLMGKSPYLSDSVLIAAIEKENVLPNVLIKDILVANPQGAKSNEVMDKVDEKNNQFDEQLLAEVLLGEYIVAAKERLEATVAFYGHQRSTNLKYLKQLYRNDTVNAWAHDSLVSLLESETGLNEKYELVFEYMGMDDWTAANNLLNSLLSLYSMNTQQQEIYQDMQQLTGVLLNLYQMDSTIYNIPGTLKTTLYNLADNSQNFSGAIARNILIEVDGYDYTEPVILPEASLKSGNIVFDLPNIETFIPEHVKIYPNPALDYIIVELNTGNATGATINLFDIQGKQLHSVNVPAQQQHYVLGLKEVPAGVYIINVDCDGKNLGGKKFSIVK